MYDRLFRYIPLFSRIRRRRLRDPAHALAALDRRLLIIAHNGRDGTLRRVVTLENPLQQHQAYHHGLHRRLSGRADSNRYGLELRQEFLNLSPMSGFIVVPPPSTASPEQSSTSASNSHSDGVRIRWTPASDVTRAESEIIAACRIGRHGSLLHTPWCPSISLCGIASSRFPI